MQQDNVSSGGAVGRALRRLFGWTDSAAAGVIITTMAVMVGVVSSQVVMRYLFNSSIDWADELSRLCFIWTIFLAIPLALKRGGHIVMELVTRVTPRSRDLLYRGMSILSFMLMCTVAWQGLQLTLDNWDENIPTLGLSGGLFFLAVCISSAHTALHLLRIMADGEPRRIGIIE